MNYGMGGMMPMGMMPMGMMPGGQRREKDHREFGTKRDNFVPGKVFLGGLEPGTSAEMASVSSAPPRPRLAAPF